jgi:ABC-2 type transport system permease protein
MKASLAAEVLKLRTTRTVLSLFLAMLGLVLLAVALHGFGLPAGALAESSSQRRVLIAGETVGAVFAALLGAMSITSELRHGTIRPTLLGIPNRRAVITAKALTSALVGLAFGLVATCAAVAVGVLALSDRGIVTQLSTDDYAQLIAGGAIASALWAVIGLGIGSLVRNQVAAVVGIFVWLQIIENLFIDSLPNLSRYTPGSLAQAIAGSQIGTLDSPIAALLLLIVYAAVVLLMGSTRIVRSDVA